jgi:hypothetical protein
MFSPTHWLHVFFISKTVGQHFWPKRGRGKRLIKEEKQKKLPPERKNQGPS